MSEAQEQPENSAAKKAPISLRKKLLFSAFVFLFTLLLLHLIAYVGLRYHYSHAIERVGRALPTIPRYADYLDLRLNVLHPYLKVTVAPNQHLPFCRINRQGYRGPDFVREKTGAFRVAIVGGSAAMGWFANSESETLHACLQAELEKAFPGRRFEVYNFAVFQYNSTQELFVLETEVLAYQPDFVIILSGINDFGWAVVEKPWQPCYPLGWIHMSTIITPGNFQEGWQRKPWLLKWTFTWTFLARTAWENFKFRCSPAAFFRNLLPAPPRTDQFFVYDDEEFQLIGPRTTLWAQNMELMARLLDSFGIPHCVSLQPFALYRRTSHPDEAKAIFQFIRDGKDRDAAVRYWTTAYPAAERALAQRPFPIQTLDVTRIFESVAEPCYFDLCHFNARGMELLARRYADHLRPIIEKRTK